MDEDIIDNIEPKSETTIYGKISFLCGILTSLVILLAQQYRTNYTELVEPSVLMSMKVLMICFIGLGLLSGLISLKMDIKSSIYRHTGPSINLFILVYLSWQQYTI